MRVGTLWEREGEGGSERWKESTRLERRAIQHSQKYEIVPDPEIPM